MNRAVTEAQASTKTRDRRPTAFRPVVIYAVVASLWILLSDNVVSFLFRDPETIHLVSSIKGVIFVAVTSGLLYGMIRRLLDKVSTLTQRESAAMAATERVQHLLSEIMDNSTDAIFAKDSEGRYLLFNREACRITGRSADEILGRDDSTLFPAEEAVVIRRNDRKVIDENRTQAYEETLTTVDGEVIYLAIKGPLREKDGRVNGMFGISRDITKRKRAEAAAVAARNQLQATLDAMPDLLFEVDAETRIHGYHSPRKELLALPPELFLGKLLADVLPPEPCAICLAALREAEDTGYSTGKQYRLDLPQGEHWFEASVSCKPVEPGETPRFIFLARDITDRKRAEEELRIAAIAFESQEGIMVTDTDGVIVRVNQAFTRLTGYSAGEAVGQKPAMLSSGRNDTGFYERIWESVTTNGYWQGEVWNRRQDGELYAEWLTISSVRSADGNVTHYVGAFSDITKDKEAQAEIHRLAYYDSLTNLPNRRLLHDRIGQAIAGSARSNAYGALLFMDIDHFKNLNDTRGHHTGDRLLTETAQRFKKALREGDTVARLGGDEFVVLLEDLSSDVDEAAVLAREVGEHLRRALCKPYSLAGMEFRCSASFGVKLFRGHDETVDTVLKHADLAMYQAKGAGRDTIRFFDPAMQSRLENRTALELDLHKALDARQLEVFYQPQTDNNLRTIGAEALLRWRHPERGQVNPGDFIPLAEDTGLILPIGQWVLEAACEQIAAWSCSPETGHLQVAVNVSARQFRQPDFVARVEEALSKTGANPRQLKLELTESLVVDDMNVTFNKMRDLKAMGVGFSLDDFGTGNSCLAYLSRLPLDQLKIDKSFVLNLPDDRNDAIIAQTIIAMAKGLGLAVIAEGVETKAQHQFLKAHLCDGYQGFLFSRPLPIAEFEQYVSKTGRDTANS